MFWEEKDGRYSPRPRTRLCVWDTVFKFSLFLFFSFSFQTTRTEHSCSDGISLPFKHFLILSVTSLKQLQISERALIPIVSAATGLKRITSSSSSFSLCRTVLYRLHLILSLSSLLLIVLFVSSYFICFLFVPFRNESKNQLKMPSHHPLFTTREQWMEFPMCMGNRHFVSPT